MAKKPTAPPDEAPRFPIEDGSERVVDQTHRSELALEDGTGYIRSRTVWSDGQRYEHVSELPNGRWVYRAS